MSLRELEVQRAERLVEQQHLGVVDEGAGDGDALLLAAGETGHGTMLKALERYESEHLHHLGLDLLLGDLFLPQGEGHVFKDVQVGEQGVLLKDGVHTPLVGGHVVDLLPQEEDVALVRRLKAADEPQQGRLAAAGGAEQGDKLVVVDVQVDAFQHRLTVERFGDVF